MTQAGDLLRRYMATGATTGDMPSAPPTGIWKYLSYLDRPWQTVSNPVHSIFDEADERNVLSAALDGLLGRREIRGRDVLEAVGMPEMGRLNLPLLGEVTGRGAAGLALEIKTDPLKFLKIGKLTPKGRKARDLTYKAMQAGDTTPWRRALPESLAGQAAQGMRTAIGIRKPFSQEIMNVLPLSADKAVMGAADVIGDKVRKSWIGQALSQPYPQGEWASALFRQSHSRSKNFQTETTRMAAKIVPSINNATKKLNMTWEQIAPTVMELAERKGRIGEAVLAAKRKGVDAAQTIITDESALKELRPLARRFGTFNKYVLRKLKRAGVPIQELPQEYQLQYAKHLLDPSDPRAQQVVQTINQWALNPGGHRVFHWKTKSVKALQEMADQNKNINMADRGYMFMQDGDIIKPDTLEHAKKLMQRGGEFRFSDNIAKTLFGSQRQKMFEALGMSRGASSIAEMNVLAEIGKHEYRMLADPFTSMAATVSGSGRQYASAKLARTIGNNSEWVANAPMQGWRKMGNQFGDLLKDKYIRPEIYEELTRSFTPDKVSPAVEQFIQKVGETTGWWKAFTLAVPGYNVRNAVTNIFFHNIFGENLDLMNHVHGGRFAMATLMDEPRTTTIAAQIGRKLLGKTTVGDLDKFMRGSIVKGYSNKKIIRLARELGVVDNEMLGRIGMVADLGQTSTGAIAATGRKIQSIAGDAGRGQYNIMSRQGPWIRNAQVVSATVEAQSRYALFIDQLRKGSTPQQAAAHVTKWCLDYAPQSLSDFERNYVQPIIPFYKFMRRFTANHLEVLLTEPGKLMPTARGLMAAQRDIPQSEMDIMPSWWREGMPLKFTDDPETGAPRYADLQNYVPISDLPGMVSAGFSPRRHIGNLIGSVTPLAKLPFEMATNVSTFSGRPIERYPGEPAEYLGLPTTRMTQHVARSAFRPGKELDQLNPFNVFGEDRMGRWTQSPQDERILAALTGFRSMVLDEQHRRESIKREVGRRKSRLEDSSKLLKQQARKAQTPLHLYLYNVLDKNIQNRISNVESDILHRP